MMSLVRSWLFLVAYSCRRQFRSRRWWLVVFHLALGLVVVSAVGMRHGWDMREFSQFVVLHMFGLFFLPLGTLLIGCAALGADREDRTLVFLLTRPLGRLSVYLGKFVAAVVPGTIFSVGGFWLLCQAGRPWSDELETVFELYLPAVLLASLAYLALFQLVGAIFRHATIISLTYVFFIEFFVGRAPGVLKRVSINFYASSMMYDAGAAHDVKPPSRVIYLPVDAEVASWALAWITVALLVVGGWLFARFENRQAGG